MYSEKARMKVIFDYDLPKEQLAEIARQHIIRDKLDNPAWRVDFYWIPWRGLVVVIDGKGVTQLAGYHKGVQDWRWDQMQDMKIEAINR